MATIEKEKDIVLLVENAIQQLKGVSDYAEKENKQIVIELAKDLEGIIPMNSICTEIINRLQGHLKPRTIRKYLDEKYKIKTRVDNARKQKTKQSSLAALGPLDNNDRMLLVNHRNDISFPDGGNNQINQLGKISVVKDNEAIGSASQKEPLNSTKQELLSKSQVNSGLTECTGCLEKEEKIKELEDAHQKVQQFIAADKIEQSAIATKDLKEAPEEPLEFEVSKKGWEIRDYFKSSKIKSYDETIWFNGRIDPNTGKVINFDLGRLYQSHQKSVPNRGLD